MEEKDMMLIQHQRKSSLNSGGNRETDVNPSLIMSQYLGKQAVSPIQAIDSDSNLNKSILKVGVEASHSSKVADRNVCGSTKIKEKSLTCKSHCSDRSEKQANSPQELYCSDENSPLGHRSRRSICEGEVVLVVHRRLLRMSMFLQIMMEILEKLVEKWAPHCLSSLRINNIEMVQT